MMGDGIFNKVLVSHFGRRPALIMKFRQPEPNVELEL